MSDSNMNGDAEKAEEQKTVVDEAPSTSKASADDSVEVLIEKSTAVITSVSRTSQEIVELNSSNGKDEEVS